MSSVATTTRSADVVFFAKQGQVSCSICDGQCSSKKHGKAWKNMKRRSTDTTSTRAHKEIKKTTPDAKKKRKKIKERV
jgi:uncharacterized Zn finger protein (UPF0148 family)